MKTDAQIMEIVYNKSKALTIKQLQSGVTKEPKTYFECMVNLFFEIELSGR